MSKLYEITGKLLELQQKLEMEECEDNKQYIVDTIESIEFSLEEKTDGILKMVKNYESDIDSINNEIARLQALKKSKQVNIDNMKEYLKDNLTVLGKDKVETALFRVTVKKTPPKLTIDNEESVPSEYMKVSYSVDKTRLKNAFQDETQANELNSLGIRLVQDTCLMIK